MNVFGDYSKYYDLLYGDKNYPAESKYIHETIRAHKPAAKTIVDFGCGTGLHDVLLAKHGYRVTGIDQSKQMIEEANTRLNSLSTKVKAKLSFKVGDIRNIKLKKNFDVCISPFHILSYQVSNKDLLNTLKTARLHLKRGGILIFDCWYGPAVLHLKPVVREKIVENEEVKVIRVAQPVLHSNENVVDVNYHMIVIDKKTNLCQEINEKHEMRFLFKPEVELLLNQTGFKLLHSEEWLSKAEVNNTTWGANFIARAV